MEWGICGLKSKRRGKTIFSVKKIYAVCIVLYCIEGILFWLTDMSQIIVVFVAFLIFIFGAILTRKQIVNFNYELEKMINTMIDGGEINSQDISYEDDLFSKVIHKLYKVSSIQEHTKKQLEYERNEVEKLVSDIAHQVKTPMTNIKMYHEMLCTELEKLPEQVKIICIIQQQVDKMDFLVQSIFKLSQLEIGIIDLKSEKTLLRICLMKALESVLIKAKQKNIAIKVRDKIELCVYCDIKWTAEAIFNILDNAIKYTPEYGQVDIFSRKTGIYSCICIQDNGIGIAKENINNIFKRFYRENTNCTEGVGIGLSLAREIIMKQNGYITVESKKNKGTLFSVCIPESEIVVRSR